MDPAKRIAKELQSGAASMTRLYGVVLMSIASLWLGVTQAVSMRRRPKTLIALADALDVLKSDTCIRMLPMPDALRNAAAVSGKAQPFFRMLIAQLNDHVPLSDAWTHSLGCLSELSADDRRAFQALGARLGRYDTSTQAEAIEQCVNTLRMLALRADEQAKTGAKLSVGLCLAGGLLFAVILV